MKFSNGSLTIVPNWSRCCGSELVEAASECRAGDGIGRLIGAQVAMFAASRSIPRLALSYTTSTQS